MAAGRAGFKFELTLVLRMDEEAVRQLVDEAYEEASNSAFKVS